MEVEIVFVMMDEVDVAIYTGNLLDLKPLDVEWKPVNESVMAVASSDIIRAAGGKPVTVFERTNKWGTEKTFVYVFDGESRWSKFLLKEELI